MNAIAILQANAATRLELLESELESGLQSAFYDTCRVLHAIRDERLYIGQYASFDAYCEKRWEFTGDRGRQLADTFALIQSMHKQFNAVGDVRAYFREWLAGFSEGHARVLKHVPEDRRGEAWELAKKVEADVTPSVRTLKIVADELTPEAIEAMPAREQKKALQDIEAKAGAKHKAQAYQDWLRKTVKRLKGAIIGGRCADVKERAADIVATLQAAKEACEDEMDG